MALFSRHFYPIFSFEIKFFIQDHDSSSADFSSSTKLPVLLTKSRTTLISLQKCVCIFVNFSLIICTRQFSALFSNKCIRKANNVRNGFYTWSQWKKSIFSLLYIVSKWTYLGCSDRWPPSSKHVLAGEFVWLGRIAVQVTLWLSSTNYQCHDSSSVICQ